MSDSAQPTAANESGSAGPPDNASVSATAYAEGHAKAAAEEAHWTARAQRISWARLACFALILLLGWLGFGTHQIARAWILAPVGLFLVLMLLHDRVLRREARAERVKRFFEEGIARIEDRWAGRGDSGERYLDPAHPYAADLDVFGQGSLFELLATTRTATGSDRLASWLLEPGEPTELRARQAAVAELQPRLDLRLEMALAGDETGSSSQQELLERWAAAPAAALPRALFFAAIGCSSATIASIGLWIWTAAGPLPLLVASAIQTIFALSIRGRVVPILAAADTPVQSLSRTAKLLACIENEHFEAPRLAHLRNELDTTGHTPSQELEALRRLADRRDARHNQFFAPIAAVLLWGTHVAMALEAWRRRCGPRLAPWIESAGEVEALCALSNLAYERPQFVFPELSDEGPVFDGSALGHPLLPTDQCMRNDLRLSRDPQALIMSGSNMSGKSTMLRTVGTNAILALAGAPVRAERLRISALRIAASIRILDSLQEGQSHFMAEIVRLRQVVEISRGTQPSLFLLDEILHGTNSHDRRIGAEAVILGLVEAGAIGIVTTHDLALTRIVPESAGRLANYHFEDHLEAGQMRFDYRLREGVVEKSNALELMRSVGLDV